MRRGALTVRGVSDLFTILEGSRLVIRNFSKPKMHACFMLEVPHMGGTLGDIRGTMGNYGGTMEEHWFTQQKHANKPCNIVF